jgi:hypothetical protein
VTAAETRKLPIGSTVWCTVRACAGWYTVTAVRQRDGYIQITGGKAFCPPHNFARTQP